MGENNERKIGLIGTLFFSLFLICFMSGTASALSTGTIRFDISLFFLWLFLVIMNLPLNGIIYIGFLRIISSKKDKEDMFENNPSVFIKDVLTVTVLATFFGAIVYTLLLILTFNSRYFFDFVIYIIMGLILISLSYYLLIIRIQKLKSIDAVKIGIGITIINLLSLVLIIFLWTITIYTILLIPIICYIVFVISIFKLKSWYTKKHISSRKKLKEKDTQNKKMEKLLDMEKQNVVSKGIIIIMIILLSLMFVNLFPPDGHHSQLLSASLTYIQSDSTNEMAVFEVTIVTPENPEIEDITCIVLDPTGNEVEIETLDMATNVTVEHIASYSTHLKSGDHITLEVAGVTDLASYEIILSISGYDGTVSCVVPT